MNKILIKLDENPSLPRPVISDENQIVIDTIIKNATDAKAMKLKPSKPVDKSIDLAIAELLENPDGVAKSDLLAVSESCNLSSLISKIRKRLHQDNLYTLNKRTQKSITIYYLKTATDNGS